ncbi:DUF3902 family protein [Bacillus sp. TH44]|uniref:DUF3902 family protein n=1 Tax=unclassified Bacillus (in: firmicutes) TaxID=185979 RepID=UPI001912B55A|nr:MULTISPECIES: DUF3902 family protein [unclassified Bacillus (in: firmicutes)]MBK5345713.1 DUF3902 family protein [Bacillus sp. TH45]MBK5360351.1 DUF3902 family protein [Bacillus sp. TH44]MBK5367246.1 DUF3902 family protein [Bacillus sp. TH50]
MKPVLKNIIISFVFSIVGVCWSLFVLFKLDADWLLSWIGVLMAYLSLYTVIGLYSRKTYDSKFAKVLVKTIITSFSFGVLGISFGIVHQILGPLSLTLMTWYWLLMLFLYLTTILSLFILVIENSNDQNYTWLYRYLILFTLLLTVGPVLWPVLYTIIGNGMNASAGW